MSLNTDLSDLFRTLAALMDIKGESTFKAIAFSKVSRNLKDMTLDLEEAVRNGTLKDLEGIGPSSQRIIEQYVKTGRSEDFDQVAASVPAGLIPMLDIPGLGPKTIALLWKERKITSLEELTAAIDQGKLDGLKGIGEKKIEAIKQGIALRSQSAGRVGIVAALEVGQAMLQPLRDLPEVSHAEFAGSLRRRCETIGDVDLVCAVKNPAAGESVSAAFVKFPLVQRILGQGPTKASVLTTKATTGCRYWASLGLKPIQTPTGTQITDAPATTTATRRNVRKPSANAARGRPGPAVRRRGRQACCTGRSRARRRRPRKRRCRRRAAWWRAGSMT